jgi:hypothetical protein
VSGRADQQRDQDSRRQGGPQEIQEMTSQPRDARRALPGPPPDCPGTGNLSPFVPISRRSGVSQG